MKCTTLFFSLNNGSLQSDYAHLSGADFIKTSTGKEGVNATLMVGLVMVRAIREYFQRTGHKVRSYFTAFVFL